MSDILTPENPLIKQFNLKIIITKTIFGFNGSPTHDACDIIKFFYKSTIS